MTMQLDESFDADAILRDPFGDEIEEKKTDDEEVEELTLGEDPSRITDLDIPDEEEDDYGL